MDVSKITKEQFDLVYNRYPANAWVKFGFKYFSRSTFPKDLWVKRTAVAIMSVSFIAGFIGTVLNFSRGFLIGSLVPLIITLVSIALIMSGSAFMNNWRIKKIRKELGINIWQYEALVNLFYPTEQTEQSLVQN